MRLLLRKWRGWWLVGGNAKAPEFGHTYLTLLEAVTAHPEARVEGVDF